MKQAGFLIEVGMRGFEPPASSSRTKRATGLRYIPSFSIFILSRLRNETTAWSPRQDSNLGPND